MRIITRKFLEAAKSNHAKARAPLDHWHRITRAAKWQSLTQTRQSFPHADQVTVTSGRTVTVFNITKESVVARQTIINPYAWPVVGLSNTQGPPMSAQLEPPAWWADALITD